MNVEEEFAGEDEATKEAAHRAAVTFGVMIDLVMEDLEAEGKIYRTGEMRDEGQCLPQGDGSRRGSTRAI